MKDVDAYILEQAKELHRRIGVIGKGRSGKAIDQQRVILVLCGIITETLLEYEEPDVVMEQSFRRLMNLLGVEPQKDKLNKHILPPSFIVDKEVEKGRALAREFSLVLPNEMDDVHEIAIALILNDFPHWGLKGLDCRESLRMFMEGVITALTLEMAVQDLCDQVIEEYMGSPDWSVSRVISSLSALAGQYCVEACDEECSESLIAVIRAEAERYGSGFSGGWAGCDVANDLNLRMDAGHIEELCEGAEEFFEVAEMSDPLFKSTALAKTAGRMMAISGGTESGRLHPQLAKSLARAAFMDGTKNMG